MIRYWSEGKQVWLDIPDMNDFQLIAGFNKLTRRLEAGEDTSPNSTETREAMREEILERGLDPAYKGGRPPMEMPGADDDNPPPIPDDVPDLEGL